MDTIELSKRLWVYKHMNSCVGRKPVLSLVRHTLKNMSNIQNLSCATQEKTFHTLRHPSSIYEGSYSY
jgi:hypothetical protein